MNTQNASNLLSEIAKRFSEESFPETCAKAMIAAPKIPSSSWSLGNQLIMIFSGTSDARGYGQWRQVYRNVKKGAKAVYILGPLTKKIKDKDEEKIVPIGFRTIPVFRYEDTEGMPLQQYEPKTLPPLFFLAEKNGIGVSWRNSSIGEYGSIDIAGRKITLSTESPDTFLHELMHFYDSKNQKLKPGQDVVQETVAQLGACVLAKMYGYDVEAYTWKYIASYVKSDSSQKIGQMCFGVLSRVQKAIDAILQDALIQNSHVGVEHVI